MKRVDALLADYGAHHRARGNLVCHAFGITLIAYGIVALLGRLPLGRWNVAEALIAGVVLYYATLDVPLAAAMLGGFVLLDLAARAVGDWRIGAGRSWPDGSFRRSATRCTRRTVRPSSRTSSTSSWDRSFWSMSF